jgi:hypothetical protein
LTLEDRVINRLKGEHDSDLYLCSWRRAGRIIAEIRNAQYNLDETYLDFYCTGEEGVVDSIVKECFDRMGWEPTDY